MKPMPNIRRIEHKGYVAVQDPRNPYVMIFSTTDGRMVMHSRCDAPMTDDELRELVDNYLTIVGRAETLKPLFDEREESGLLEED